MIMEMEMDTFSMEPKPGERPSLAASKYNDGNSGGLIPDVIKTILLLILLLAVGYLLYSNYQNRLEIAKITDSIQALQSSHKTSEDKIAGLTGEISQAKQAVGDTKTALQKTAAQIQAEGSRTRQELNEAIASKADAAQVQAQVQAAKTETEAKIGQVSTEVGGVKTEVSTVKTDLATTKRDLEGTQRQLVDVKDSLTAAVAKNSTELAELRRKGERDYFEFQIPKKNQMTKVEDIRIILTKTDEKKGKYSMKIVVDDNQLEKKDRTINEPVQFLVGRNRVRYELVVNWIKKDSAGGYLSIPKDKVLSSEQAKP
jgi:septal ring factor EnvC (AmiA/AmiB activator)